MIPPAPVLPTLAISLVLLLTGCGAPVVKPDAFDRDVLERLLDRDLAERRGGEVVVDAQARWLQGVDPASTAVFVGYRDGTGGTVKARVMECDPAADRLVVRLASDELVTLSIVQAIAERRLGSPVPEPTHVFAVAANFPSHLEHDLAVADAGDHRSVLAASRPRVFLKHPPPTSAFGGVIGPFDTLRFPSRIDLPPGDDGEPRTTETRVDYEVEVGVVVGRALTWDDVADATDDELRAAISGLVLVSDAKARNPQVLQRVRSLDAPRDPDDPYRIADDDIDAAVSAWTAETCRWWSYAAGHGDYLAIGPFLVETPLDLGTPRAAVAARSYAPSATRGARIPAGRSADTLYLRQCSVVTTDPAHPDAVYWDLPGIIRSILEPGGALSFMGEPITIEAGDIICLGTPGGTVVTSKPYGLLDFLENAIFFWRPVDFHDAFFGGDAHLYLRTGDRVFLWADGLGFQLLDVEDVASP